MAYELTLEPDRDRGGSRYRVALSGEVAPAVVRQVSDWLADAMQNPDASFEIDLSDAGRTSPRLRLELRALVRRHRALVEQRRLTVVAPRRWGRRGAAAAGHAGASASLVDGLLGISGSGALPL
jgi:hypothetical protein